MNWESSVLAVTKHKIPRWIFTQLLLAYFGFNKLYFHHPLFLQRTFYNQLYLLIPSKNHLLHNYLLPIKMRTGLNTSQHKCNKDGNKNHKNYHRLYSSSSNIIYLFIFTEKLLKILVYTISNLLMNPSQGGYHPH